MVDKFINPNWHVILIHYPLGLLVVGLIIELLNLYWQRDRFRAAGRWMMTIGGLMMVVTALAGIYAFRDIMISGPMTPDFKWSALLAANHWSPDQWKMLSNHIWFNSISSLIVVAVIAVWLSRNEEWRHKFHWLMLLLLVIATGLLMVGAWHGGEMVYRYGMAVRPNIQAQGRPAQTGEPAESTANDRERQTAGDEGKRGLAWLVPPLQSHVVLAGITAALAIAAIGLTFYGWTRTPALPPPVTAETIVPSSQLQLAEHPPVVRFWIAALIAGALTALTGLWSVLGTILSWNAIKADFRMLAEPDHRRLLVHVIAGLCIIALAVILAVTTRVTQLRHRMKLVFVVLALIAVALQVWLGTLMIFDSHEGPLTRFSAAAAAAPQPSHHVPTTTQSHH